MFFSYSASSGAPILYLEDLFVEEAYRHQGICKALLSKLANLSIENHCCRMEWHAL
ncbi:GNAT family N-acetyltransferase [Aquicella siphonis]|uniref:GNAT family N-acetyltransferase n=1 Tax=Aquicella siphonis TaxID=254247 RepID=UPI0038BAD5BD